MSAPRRITPEDLTLFAMQLLSREEAAEVSAYLEQSEEARRNLAEVQGDLAMYAHTVDMHAPPALTRERLLKQVAREQRTVPIDRGAAVPDQGNRARLVYGGEVESGTGDEGRRPVASGRGLGNGTSLTEDDLPKRSLAGKVFPWIGWAVAAGLAVAAGKLYHERESMHAALVSQATKLDHLTADAAAARQVLDAMTDSTAMRVTLTQSPTAPAPQGRATYVADKGTLIFLANNLEPLPALKTYELWLIPAAPGRDPIPAGTFHPDKRGNASVILPPLPKGVEAKAFGVTIEDEGGAATPTLPIILVGT
jgi:anti-sigma-K factor RskA